MQQSVTKSDNNGDFKKAFYNETNAHAFGQHLDKTMCVLDFMKKLCVQKELLKWLF